jgi:hypothetical protein
MYKLKNAVCLQTGSGKEKKRVIHLGMNNASTIPPNTVTTTPNTCFLNDQIEAAQFGSRDIRRKVQEEGY